MFHREECVSHSELDKTANDGPLLYSGRPSLDCGRVFSSADCRRGVASAVFSFLCIFLIISLSFYPAAGVAPENETTRLVVDENEERKR